jgi:GNAT superfamily N-acetyltransferase
LRATLRAVSNFLIRRAVISERRELESLQWRASIANAGDREALQANPDAIELPENEIADGCVFVFEQDSMILGFAVLLPREDGEAELDGLFVDPGSRRGGIGRLLVEHCAQIARVSGSGALCVIGNPHAFEFYRACGFHVVGKTDTRFGEGILMRKPIVL